ncbi:alpha/beta hydrolase family protein [Tenacibaculum sp. 190524A05c]|uniref:alpha/beta hydrolase family protein n=1 Tax=Tenacibaculum platacis TaxID=3137852 RepID=UPI0032B22F7D
MTRLLLALITLITSSVISLCAQTSPRPQDPVAPLPYLVEEVSFVNSKENITLAGTLTLPKNEKNPPVAILISGSGPQNRDSEVKAFNHRPFLVLSDYLTRNGIAVLRYDDRGIAESKGNFKTATTHDFADDAESAVAYLKTRKDVINTNQIGLIGHSEGGIIGAIASSRNKDVAFFISLAGPGVDGKEILLTQSRKALELKNVSSDLIDFNEMISNGVYSIVQKEPDSLSVAKSTRKFFLAKKKELPKNLMLMQMNDQVIDQQIKAVTDKWLMNFIKTDPKPYFAKVTCPFLALNGSKDIQVLSELNLNAIRSALKTSTNKDVEIKELEGFNHLFQVAETGSIEEYAKIDETFSEKAMVIIKDWILKRF